MNEDKRIGATDPTVIRSKIEAFILKHPQRDSGSWEGWGGSLVWRLKRWLGENPRAYSDVMLAIGATRGLLNPRSVDAPPGAVHFFRAKGLRAANAGVDIDGGGRRMVIATGKLGFENATVVGQGLQVMPVRSYAVVSMEYVGWSRDYGERGW